MRRIAALLLLGTVAGLGLPGCSGAQDPSGFLAVGEPAPNIEVVGAVRHGVLNEPVKLSDLRGETVVLAFFFKARTGG